MKKTLTALAVAASLAGGAAFAQEADMDQSLSMLEVAAERELAKVGITDVDVMALTLSQLAEIKAITDSTDSNQNDMARAVMQVVDRN